MAIHLWLIAIFLLASVRFYAQERHTISTSYAIAQEQQMSDVDKIEQLVGKCRSSVLISCEEASAISQTVEAFYRENPENIYYQALSLITQANVCDCNGDYLNGIQKHELAIKLLYECQKHSMIGLSYNDAALLYQRLGKPEKALELLNEALKAHEKWGKDKKSISLSNIGYVYDELGQDNKALKYYYMALAEDHANKNELGAASTQNMIANMYFDNKEYKKALAIYLQCLKVNTKYGANDGIASNCSNLSFLYQVMGNPDSSLYYSKMHVEADLKTGNRLNIANSYNDIGYLCLRNGKLVEAQYYLEKAMTNAEEIKEHTLLLKSYSGMATTLLTRKKARPALAYFKKAEKLIPADNWLESSYNAYSQSLVYEMLGDYKAALEYERMHQVRNDSLLRSQNQLELLKTQEKHELMLQKERYEKQNKQASLEKLKMERHTFLIVLMVIVLLFLSSSVFSYLLHRARKKLLKLYNRLQVQSNEIELKNKQLEISNHDLEEYAYVAAHDLKEPLRTIGSYSSLLRRRIPKESQTEEISEYLSFLVTASGKMSKLLDELLRYATIDKEKVNMEMVDLEYQLNEVVDSIDMALEERNVEIVVNELPSAFVNAMLIRQVFQNMIINGVKFNKSEVPRIEIYSTTNSDKGVCTIFIKDNGIGIEKGQESQIFGVFRRIHQREYEGSGIGLSLCQKIIAMHGGEIGVESEVGVGSTFYFTLPIKSKGN